MSLNLSRQKIRDLLSKSELDALVFCQKENLRYLCGFSGSDGVIIATSEQLVFMTDSRYTTQAKNEVTADVIEEYKNKFDAVTAHLRNIQAIKIGVENSLTVGNYESFVENGEADWLWVNLKERLHSLRLHKSPHEIEAITAAADLNYTAFSKVVETIRPGVRENEVSLALEFELRKLGAEEKAFDIIVASGQRGALPHGVASNKVIEQGELVTIDFGCRCSGFFSDETVTLAVGDIAVELRKIYDTVLEAHDRAIKAVVPGGGLADIDKIARGYINDCGFGDYFGHGLGHGVGLEVHEAPVVSPKSKLFAEEGMVFTIEPGVYVPGLGGVRIEDMVLVTDNGCRLLTKIPKMFHNILLN